MQQPCVKEINASDFKMLLKGRLHSNKMVSHISNFFLKKYIEAFPLILLDFSVLTTTLDCIQALSE